MESPKVYQKRPPRGRKPFITENGYRNIFVDGRKRREHLVVWEKHFGPLQHGQYLVHKNGDKLDNRIENLEIRL